MNGFAIRRRLRPPRRGDGPHRRAARRWWRRPLPNGFDALAELASWDGTAAALVPRLERLERVLSDVLATAGRETAHWRAVLGARVLAVAAARSEVRAVAEAARGGSCDALEVARLVGAVGGALVWYLAGDAQHGAVSRLRGHRPMETARDAAWSRRVAELRAAGEGDPLPVLHQELTAEGVHISMEGLRKAIWRHNRRRNLGQ